MNRVNPEYILCDYLAQIAIGKARDGKDYSEMERLRKVRPKPFDEQPEFGDYAKQPPVWAKQQIAVGCSS